MVSTKVLGPHQCLVDSNEILLLYLLQHLHISVQFFNSHVCRYELQLHFNVKAEDILNTDPQLFGKHVSGVFVTGFGTCQM